MQVIFIGFELYALTAFIAEAIRWSEERTADLATQPADYYPQWVYDVSAVATFFFLLLRYWSTVYNALTLCLLEQLVPSPEQVQIALWPAFGVAVFVLISLFFCYLPSYMRIVIELRCGIVPSLTSELFTPYRAAVDSVRYSCLSC